MIKNEAGRTELPWFAVQVKSRHERTVAQILENKEYETFLPLYKQRRKNRRTEITLPLFNGYIFCKLNPSAKSLIVSTPGVVRIVGSKRGPIPISDKEIHAIQAVDKCQLKARPHPYVTVGSRVVIDKGPLSGMEAIVKDFKNRYVALSIELLQRSILVEVDANSFRVAGVQHLEAS